VAREAPPGALPSPATGAIASARMRWRNQQLRGGEPSGINRPGSWDNTISKAPAGGPYRYQQTGAVPSRNRTVEQLAGVADGMKSAEPGMSPVFEWRSGPCAAETLRKGTKPVPRGGSATAGSYGPAAGRVTRDPARHVGGMCG
jgi:hypothetical protein